MIPFKVTAAAHNANVSPSVTLEKGSYRLRVPRTSQHALRTPANPDSRCRSPGHSLIRRNRALLVFLLMLACFFCFAAAWYLYSTRWDSRCVDRAPDFTDQPEVREVRFGRDDLSTYGPNFREKYMTYLPHSGFHNQRIALENAIVLSILLNRTLIIPPVRLGKKPVRYVKYESLTTFLAIGGKEGLGHCSITPSHMALAAECFDYFDYTHISWNWLVNLTQYTHLHPQVHEWNMLNLWSRKPGGSSVMVLPDESPYHYRFHDLSLDMSVVGNAKYKEQVFISDIANSDQFLMQLGSLFGTSRLLLRSPSNLAIRTMVRQNMVYSNPILVSVVDNIRSTIGGPYFGAHIRISDGQFEKNSLSNIRHIWWQLIKTCYGYSHSDGIEMERIFQESENKNNALDFSGLHNHPHIAPLNTPLFISTDVENPRQEPSFSIFLRTFPCLFISDFQTQFEPLREFRNANDGLELGRFLVPFLDAMILGHASKIVTTEGSTFGRFAEDVLWRVYHGREIIQRG
ncbi:hypothetical protein APHAL10511_000142 [Amanita phalloides]|nr:hypothetical protein APHAL10511_000142 [Amanita phalloides]